MAPRGQRRITRTSARNAAVSVCRLVIVGRPASPSYPPLPIGGVENQRRPRAEQTSPALDMTATGKVRGGGSGELSKRGPDIVLLSGRQDKDAAPGVLEPGFLPFQ